MEMTVAQLSGPSRVPVVGNLPAFARGGTPHRTLERWHDRYGATFRMRFPGSDVVVTSSPAILDTVLRGRPDAFRRARFMSDLIDELGAHGLFNAEGEDWRRLRRVAMRGLNAKYLRATSGCGTGGARPRASVWTWWTTCCATPSRWRSA
jgi:cytochrome P450